MGNFVNRLEKRLNGDYDKGLWIAVFIGSFALGLATPLIAFNLDSGGLISFIAIIGSIVFIPSGITSLLASIYEVQAEAQEFVEAYKMDYPKEPGINLIEAGYKRPTNTRIRRLKMLSLLGLALEFTSDSWNSHFSLIML